MNNPFGNDDTVEDDDMMSDGDQETEHFKDLMKAQLEISPLVPFVPPMPEAGKEPQAKRPYTGPSLSVSSSREKSDPVVLKRRKLNEDAKVSEQDFHDVSSPTRPGANPAPVPASTATLDVVAPADAKLPPPASLAPPEETVGVKLEDGSDVAGLGGGSYPHQAMQNTEANPGASIGDSQTAKEHVVLSGYNHPGLAPSATAAVKLEDGSEVAGHGGTYPHQAVPLPKKHVVLSAYTKPRLEPLAPRPGLEARVEAKIPIPLASRPPPVATNTPLNPFNIPATGRTLSPTVSSPSKRHDLLSLAPRPPVSEMTSVPGPAGKDVKDTPESPPRPFPGVTKDKRADILAIVTGTRSPIKVKPPEESSDKAPSEVAAQPEASAPSAAAGQSMAEAKQSVEKETKQPEGLPVKKEEDTKSPQETKEVTKKRRKKIPNPTRRVLISKKEKEGAIELMRGKIDLLSCLPKKDCMFLGRHCWIFTGQQLMAVLDGSSEAPPGDNGKSNKAKEMREDLVNKLAFAYHKHKQKILEEGYAVAGTGLSAEKMKSTTDEDDFHGHSISSSTEQEEPKLVQPMEIDETDARSEASPWGKKPVDDGTATVSEVFEPCAQSDRPPVDATPDLPPVVATPDHPPVVATPDRPPMVASPDRPPVDATPDHPPVHAGVAVGAPSTSDNPFNLPVPVQPKPEVQAKSELPTPSKCEPTEDIVKPKTPPVEYSEDARLLAESKLNEWKDLVEAAVPCTEVSLMKESFPFDGPISYLVPQPTRNFLASCKVVTLYHFLCLRKTETGAICDMLTLWRQVCNLQTWPCLALAKHLLGVAYRLEIAIGNELPVNFKTRRWLNDAIVIMTGAARDFLVDHLNLATAQAFLDARTKELSEKLAAWRVSTGLVPLKGSGKVAMISGWKANCREEIDIGTVEGRVLTDVDLEAMSASRLPIVKDETRPNPKTAPKPKPTPKKEQPKPKGKQKPNKAATARPPKSLQSSPKVDYVSRASNSLVFVQQVLGKKTATFLSSIGINTAAELEKAKKDTKHSIYQQLLETKRADDMPGCQKLVDGWSSKLTRQLKELNKKEEPILKKPSPPKLSTGTQKQTTVADPYDALSVATQIFLGGIGITTAEEFLSSRTTDIAAEFVKWRIKEGKPELKGLGSIASVSGWKAQCRKAASEMGFDKIAALEPSTKPSGAPAKKKPSPVGTEDPVSSVMSPLSSLLPPLVSSDDNNVLSETSSLVFAVQKSKGSNRKFFFQLSLRRPQESAPLDHFLTYRGASPVGLSSVGSKESLICLDWPLPNHASVLVPVLASVPKTTREAYTNFDERAPFAFGSPDFGLIELSTFGVMPRERQELGQLKTAIEDFIFERHVAPLAADYSVDHNANVLIHRQTPGGLKFFLYMTNTLEKGQTCALRFPSISSLLRSERYGVSSRRTRLRIEDSISVLAQVDLEDILKWLKRDILDGSSLSEVHNKSGGLSEDVCRGRRRLHWVSRLTLGLLKVSDGNKEGERAFYFGPHWSGKDALTEAQTAELKGIVSLQLKEELLACVENDSVCGTHMRPKWCKVARDVFDASLDQLVACYNLPVDDCAGAFFQKMKTTLSPFFQDGEKYVLADLETGIVATTSGKDSENTSSGTEFLSLEPDRKGMIACEGGPKQGQIQFKSLEDITSGGTKVKVAFSWYKELVWGIASRLLLSFEQILDETERKNFKVKKALISLRSALNAESTPSKSVSSPYLSQDIIRMPWGEPTNQDSKLCIPGSYQFFLGIVWPALREQGWRLDAGDSPADVIYFPPRANHRKRSALLKQERNRKRMRLSREIDKIGWGSVKKLTKRIVAAISPGLDTDDGILELPGDSTSVTVEESTKQLIQWVQKDLPTDDSACTERAKSIAVALRDCFDQIAPSMSSGAGWPVKAGDTIPSASVGAEAMLQLLLVLPSVLRQSSLQLQEISDSLQIIQDMTHMFTANYEQLLDKRFHPPVEKYSDEEKPVKSNLAERLKLLKPSPAVTSGDTDESDANELTEAILEDDKKSLTDFVVLVMEQFIPCRATEKDAEKKFRRIHVGHAGLTCRHCLGLGGEGRYFFSSIESLTTASTVLEKHVYKCPNTPPEIRSKVVSAKATHTAQRKDLEIGSQQGYFNRLWDRLRSSQIGGEAVNVPTSSAGYHETKVSSSDGAYGDVQEFRDHLRILDFVRTTLPWRNSRIIQGALSKYYSCLDYGGRIYNTPSMPEHFSSEWLLAKVCPKRYEYAKTKKLPG